MQAVQHTWARSHADKADNEYEAVFALEHYFRAHPFRYNLTPHLTARRRRWPSSC